MSHCNICCDQSESTVDSRWVRVPVSAATVRRPIKTQTVSIRTGERCDELAATDNTGDSALGDCLKRFPPPPPTVRLYFPVKPPPSTTLLFLLEKRKRRQRERRRRGRSKGVAISFRVPARLIGSWQHMEPWGRFAHAHFWRNKYLPWGERQCLWVKKKKKKLISLQTHREIKVGKTYPSKGCRLSFQMEISPRVDRSTRLLAELMGRTHAQWESGARLGSLT